MILIMAKLSKSNTNEQSENILNTNYRKVLILLFAGIFALLGIAWLMPSDAEEPKPIVNIPAPTNPASSNTNVKIVFASKEGNQTHQIWKMNPDGTNKVRLTNDNESQQEWSRPSPDGKSILFMKADKDSSVNFAVHSNRLWLMNTDGTNQREIIGTQKKDSYKWSGMAHAEWSPDSSRIVLAATLPNLTSQIITIDTNGNDVQQVTKPLKIDGKDTVVSDPSWSSTNQIVYIRSWECFGVCSYADVFKTDYSSRQETRVTNDSNWNFDPYISPDGKTYLWLSFRSSNLICPCDLMKGNVAGELRPTPVIADGGANANGTFSSDSQQILFLKQVGLIQVLHKINIDGTGLTKIGSGESGIASFMYEPSTSPDTPITNQNNTDNKEPDEKEEPKPPVTPPDTESPVWKTDSSVKLKFDGNNYPFWQGKSCNIPSSCSLDLSWPVAVDNVGIKTYEIWRSSPNAKSAKIGATDNKTTSFRDPVIESNINYQYKIFAVDSADNRAPALSQNAKVECIPFIFYWCKVI